MIAIFSWTLIEIMKCLKLEFATCILLSQIEQKKNWEKLNEIVFYGGKLRKGNE